MDSYILAIYCNCNKVKTYNFVIVELLYGLLQENGPDLKWDAAKNICSKYINKRSVNFELILVYGHAGNKLLIVCGYSYR